MASSINSLPSPDISDVMNLLSTMKNQNEEILAKNKEILTKLNSIEDDNRKLKQELHEIKSLQKYNDNVSSKKRDTPEDATKHQNEEQSNTNKKKARISVASLSLPHPPEPPASFDNTLDDDCLGNILDFVGKSCYSVFGRVNKRCLEMFCSKGYPKETYLFGYAPLHLIQQRERYNRGYYNPGISKGVLHYNRRDILDWLLTDESYEGYWNLKCLCYHAIKESRVDILREVFQRVNELQLEYLRNCDAGLDLCSTAAEYGKLECLKLLRESECGWNRKSWIWAKENGHEHILQYFRDNDYPTEWQNYYGSEENSDY